MKKNIVPRNKHTKGDKRLQSENCKKLMKEIEENKTNGKIYHFYGLEESILSK